MLTSSTPEEDRILGAHCEYLERLTDRGVVLLAGRTLNTDPSGFGIVVFTASSEAEARRLMKEDPAIEAGLFRAELFPYRVALASEKILESSRRTTDDHSDDRSSARESIPEGVTLRTYGTAGPT